MISLRHALFGKAISRHQAGNQHLSKTTALAILSSDALSSVAYATEEILRALLVAGTAALFASWHIAVAIAILMVIVGMSYRQAIYAYPQGGGAYAVAKENLSPFAGLVAAGALMLDYTLTLAVSVAAGTRAITSMCPSLFPHSTLIAVCAVLLVMWLNLRGLRTAGTWFALPTYLFVACVFVLLGAGAWEIFNGTLTPLTTHVTHPDTLSVLSTIVLLRAFSSGCSAMTGVEAVANGVPIFKKPRAKNAAITMMSLIGLLVVMFLGISILAFHLHVTPEASQSVLSELAHATLGNGVMYHMLQISTALILLLAANTAFAGFPRLASILAQDSYLPRQLKNLGDRLAFNNGILLVGLAAIILLVLFHADTHLLIPLYAIGVFLAFTLCQVGLVRFWKLTKRGRWQAKALLNGIGAIATFTALAVMVESKFLQGAWLAVLLIALLVYAFYRIARHYKRMDSELTVSADAARLQADTGKIGHVIVLVSKLHRGTVAAIKLAKSLNPEATALTIDTHSEGMQSLKTQFEQSQLGLPLICIEAPHQSIVDPLIEAIAAQDKQHGALTTLILPKAVPHKTWHFLLHNQKANLIRLALSAHDRKTHPGKTRVVIEVPYHLT